MRARQVLAWIADHLLTLPGESTEGQLGYRVAPGDWPASRPLTTPEEAREALRALDRLEEP